MRCGGRGELPGGRGYRDHHGRRRCPAARASPDRRLGGQDTGALTTDSASQAGGGHQGCHPPGHKGWCHPAIQGAPLVKGEAKQKQMDLAAGSSPSRRTDDQAARLHLLQLRKHIDGWLFF